MKPISRPWRWLIAAIVFLLLFTVTGFFILPPIVKSQAEKRLSAGLGRTVTIGKIRLNPYALSMTIENFDIRSKDGTGSFLGWNRLYVNFDALSSLFGEWVVSEVELDGAHLGVDILPDGSLNFADLMERVQALTATKPGAGPAKPMRPIRVASFKVGSARVEFKDLSRAKPFDTVLGPMTFTLTEFRTESSHGAPYHFAATTESGEKLAWTGSLSASPVESHGEFALENLVLKKYTPYFENKISADLTDGKLSVSGRYEAGYQAGQATLKLAGGEVHLRDLHLNERTTGGTAVELPALDVVGIDADAMTMKAKVGSVALTGGHLVVRREKDGSLNLLAMLQPPAGAGPATSPTAAAPAGAPPAPLPSPDVLIGAVTLKNFKVDLTDNAGPRPAQLGLSDLQLSIKNATLAAGAVMPLDLSLSWAPQGTVKVQGSVTLKPEITADLKTDVAGLAILPLSPYFEQFVNARVTQGTVTTTNTVHAALPAGGGAPAITFAGDISADKFGLVDGLRNEELAGFAGLSLKNLKAATSPQLEVSLDEVAVTSPYARIVINGAPGVPYLQVLKEADQHVNLTAVLKPLAPGSGAAGAPVPVAVPSAKPVAAAPWPKIQVGRVVITGGDFSFNDRAIEPNVRIAMNQFGGTISGLSSENLAKAEVDLRGMVDGSGPVAITGKLDPLGKVRSVDLKIDFKNVDLLPLSPYAGRFAGYELARGQLVVDTKVTVLDRKLDSATVVTLNQFTFGAATNSPDATGLPVRLGVALLKDGDGRIVVDMPVQGNLDDPDFKYGKVVMRVIANILAKAATSPFSLLGSMFGGGGDELAYQEFQPGRSDLQAAELPKLDTLVKALAQRPALSLGLEGAFDTVADTYALKRLKFADFVRRQAWEEQHAVNPNIPPPDQFTLTPEASEAMIKKLFNIKFPPGTKFGTPLPPEPTVAAPPPPPPPGLFRRLVNVVTLQKQRDERAAKKAAAQHAAEHEKAVATAAATGLPLAEMTGRLAEAIEISDNDLRDLAAARAQRVRDRLVTEGHIAADRLFLSQSKDVAKANKGPRVFLTLQ